MGLFSFLKAAGSKLFGGKSEAAPSAPATNPNAAMGALQGAAGIRSGRVNSCIRKSDSYSW